MQFPLNSTINRVTKASPLELLIRRVARPMNLMTVEHDEPEVDLDLVREQLVQNIERKSSYDKKRFDGNKASANKLNLGGFFLLKMRKGIRQNLMPNLEAH